MKPLSLRLYGVSVERSFAASMRGGLGQRVSITDQAT
jgi:hypothetical protein